MTADILPNPVFEGSEKRIEVNFTTSTGSPENGLRALSRAQLDELMDLARCTIVSSRTNAHLDAYVLSESSLFVYPTKWVLKTCGTTRLLNSLPRLLEMAGTLGMQAAFCKYTRASFLFPEQQLFPHTSFDDEVQYLDDHFGKLGLLSKANVLGEQFNGLQWHVYTAGTVDASAKPTFNLELSMTDLGLEAAKQFVRSDTFVSAEHTTKETGILYVKPNAIIDDYVFEPCGYSMNGIEGTGLMTIHVTPEPGFSYASLEVSGHAEDLVDPSFLLAAAVKIFQPGKIAFALSVDNAGSNADSWGVCYDLPAGYGCAGSSTQDLGDAGKVIFANLSLEKLAAPGSPTTVLHHAASFLSVNTSADSDGENISDPEAEAARA
mmetsp:Transcript_37727/g.84057  ORF Transcript_37727/g.84057 Transcript_37727/m.84057 type:complete len:378 (+) Transcript_37727:302-1435(+)|eukprot:CAMPEP_0202900216 /NCGR_PEP_ID=MMETSP1392-20130828/10416_1 /ASSEMBLY_ACC=CAM_ASM_000868 /TAXON_ID=225041 /ORGANISM="Chlamydomonas chlamydogama, Strain SAG 11-48b" /LENGTH=377 /DNA_ID=CAMNT_0049586561 /DNA_START=302 /DNA_END=1435 /DNA_ORIENTATION=+